MGNSLILHDSLHIRKVQIDDCRHVNQVRDSLYALLQNLVRLLQRFRHGRSAINNFKYLIIRYYNQRVHTVFQPLNASERIGHPGSCLKTEGLRHHAYGQYPHFFRDSCNDRSRSRSCSAAHAAGYEHHIRAGKRIGDLVRALLSRLLAHLRLCAGTQPLRQLLSDLKQFRGLAQLKRLLVRIHPDKFHTVDFLIDHSIHSIIARSADTDHDDSCGRLSIV